MSALADQDALVADAAIEAKAAPSVSGFPALDVAVRAVAVAECRRETAAQRAAIASLRERNAAHFAVACMLLETAAGAT